MVAIIQRAFLQETLRSNDTYDLTGVGDTKELAPVLDGPSVTLDGLAICPGDGIGTECESGDLNLGGEIVYPYAGGRTVGEHAEGGESVSQSILGKWFPDRVSEGPEEESVCPGGRLQ